MNKQSMGQHIIAQIYLVHSTSIQLSDIFLCNNKLVIQI